MSSITITINELNAASSVIVLVLSFISFVPGGVGLIFNVLVFTRASLRREPCAVYFFSSTCFSLFVVFGILPVRIYAIIFNVDMAAYNLGICKIEFFALNAARVISSWLIVLACIDRFFHSSSNARIRRMSSLRTARIAVGITSIVMIILQSHMIGYYEISNVSDRFGNITPACNSQKGIYRTFLGFWNMVLYSLCPSFLMLLFGFLTLKNLRHHRCVIPIAGEINRIARRTDTQLLRMLAAQVLVIIIATLPFSIYQLYASFTSSFSKDTLRIAQENLVVRTVNTTTYFAHSSSFYLYTLTGTVFRKELLKNIRRCWRSNQNISVMTRGEMHQRSVLQRSQQITSTRNRPIQNKNDNIAIRETNI